MARYKLLACCLCHSLKEAGLFRYLYRQATAGRTYLDRKVSYLISALLWFWFSYHMYHHPGHLFVSFNVDYQDGTDFLHCSLARPLLLYFIPHPSWRQFLFLKNLSVLACSFYLRALFFCPCLGMESHFILLQRKGTAVFVFLVKGLMGNLWDSWVGCSWVICGAHG